MSLAQLGQLGHTAAAVGIAMVALWLVSLAKKDASIVDIAWGLGFTLIAWLTWWSSARSLHDTLLAAMVTTWGVRLAAYIAVRNHGRGEDVRYQTLRKKYAPFWWKSLFIVFALQGVLMLIVALPLEFGMHPAGSGANPDNGADAATGPVGVVDVVGLLVFFTGFIIEAVADLQLYLWKRSRRAHSAGDKDPGVVAAVMDRGLWGRSRHPNYFGEFVLWWGIGIAAFSLAHPWVLAGPATISFLLMRVSGVPMLEAQMKARPGYADYVKNTPAFFPRPFTRRGASSPR